MASEKTEVSPIARAAHEALQADPKDLSTRLKLADAQIADNRLLRPRSTHCRKARHFTVAIRNCKHVSEKREHAA